MNRFSLLALGMLSVAAVISTGCSQEVEHKESDKPNLLGGHTHEESTTYKNADGTYTTEQSKVKTQ
jgi:ABC-type oligopeptide transport system substrate-binding subunit